jgi:hypothetical protein
MRDAGKRALAVKRSVKMHEAGVIDCRADLGAGIQDAHDLLREHGGRNVRVFD